MQVDSGLKKVPEMLYFGQNTRVILCGVIRVSRIRNATSFA
jgi:hypothetical protein